MNFRALIYPLTVLLCCLVVVLAGRQLGKEKKAVSLSGEKDLVRNKRGVVTTLTLLFAGISAGASVAATGAQVGGDVADRLKKKSKVVVELQVDNFSKWSLTNPVTVIHGGTVVTQPTFVAPGSNMKMVMKQKIVWYGSWGTVSWDVNGRSVVVLWSAPCNFNNHSNTLAVGIMATGDHSKRMWDDMYRSNNWYSNQSVYRSRISTVRYCDDVICISGNMGVSHQPKVNIYVYPRNVADLAPGIENHYSLA